MLKVTNHCLKNFEISQNLQKLLTCNLGKRMFQLYQAQKFKFIGRLTQSTNLLINAFFASHMVHLFNSKHIVPSSSTWFSIREYLFEQSLLC